jgi:hypothetical protein
VLGRLRLDRISGEVVARLFARLRTKLKHLLLRLVK